MSRANFLFLFLTEHAVKMLSWSREDTLPDKLRNDTTKLNTVYYTILYNDEVHTYDQVCIP